MKTKISLAMLVLAGFASLAFSSVASACSTDAWDAVSGTAIADGPEAVSRFSEHCAFQVAKVGDVDSTGYVQSNKAADSRYIARFYVMNNLTGTGDVTIFKAFAEDGATTELFRISLDGSQFTFDAGAAGGQSASVTAFAGWNSVEFEWNSSEGTFAFWVNDDSASEAATVPPVASGAGTVQAIRLGSPDGFGDQTGVLSFDAFESHRSTPVGMLLECDAQGDDDIDINDILAVVDEIFGNPVVLADGQPDCDLNGSVNINDVLAIVDILF